MCGNICLDSSSHNIISGNIVSNSLNHDGIDLSRSDNNVIKNNIIKNNLQSGIRLGGSDKNTIIENIISDHDIGRGIILYSCNEENQITRNNITNNRRGIDLSLRSYYNIITKNNITNNDDYGLYICFVTIGCYLEPSNYNEIYLNNFIDNGVNAYDECDNIWNLEYKSEGGGNYWSDFDEPSEGAYDCHSGRNQNKPDNDGDGVVDTSYNIPGGDNIDRYPLMEPGGKPKSKSANLLCFNFLKRFIDCFTLLEQLPTIH